MRFNHRLLAIADSMGTGSLLSSRPTALLPPIPLYRRIFRAHRKLPKDYRLLADEFLRAEFRAHRAVDNPVHIVGFLSEWQMYVQQVEGDSWKGGKLDKSKLDKMSDEQINQLYELMQAIKEHGAGEGDGPGSPPSPPT